MKTRLFFLFLFLIDLNACSEKPLTSKETDLKHRLNSILNSDNISIANKKDSLKYVIRRAGNDSIKNDLLLELSYYYSKTGEYDNFRFWNSKSRNFSFRFRDSIGIAETFWDAAHFHFEQEQPDSAFIFYSKTYNLFEKLEKPIMAGQVMLNMAICQKNIQDYTGSEISTVKAIKLLKNSGKNRTLHRAHNNLGIIYNELKEHKKSLEQYSLALAYLQKVNESEKYELSVFNNIGVLLHSTGEYEEAVEYFNKVLSYDSLAMINPKIYAMTLDNRAYTGLLMKDTTGILNAFNHALEVRDSIGHTAGVIINKIHLSEYYALKRDTAHAIELAKEANILACQTSNNRDILASLKLLSEYDQKNSKEYLDDYIKLSDSLKESERLIRNKFAKIRFDTDFYIAENEELYGQRDVLIAFSLGIVLLGFSGFLIKNERTKNRELILKQEQQKANEEIFKLLLDQQDMKEEGRQKERKRLSEELHDGILAKLFGLRLSLTSLNSRTGEASIVQREKYLKDLKKLEKEIRELSHELNSSFFTSGTGYLSILEEVLSQQSGNSFSYKLRIDDTIDWNSISGSIKLHLLRILQEAVKNVKNHSGANHVFVSINLNKNFLIFIIEDNGIGFEPTKNNEGIGLKNMQSRTKAMKGNFHIESDMNKGTEISIQVPF